MLTLEEAAQTLGLSPRQLRRRIEATRPLLAPYMRRGDKNRILLDYAAVEILRHVEDARARGKTLREALSEVAESLRGNHGGEHGLAEGKTAGETSAKSDSLMLLIEELRERVKYLEEENRRLWSLVQDLQQRLPALPPPRRPWWAFWRKT